VVWTRAVSDPAAASPPLLPLPYQRDVVAYLKETEPELWAWVSSSEALEDYAREIRTQLLKENYRLDADGHPELLQRCADVALKLGVQVPVTLYQANGGFGMNAMLCYLPGEAHVIFTGPILSTLKGSELDALLAHELAHYKLWEMENGDFLKADRLLITAANHAGASASHVQTARRFRLYTEIFADRGSLVGCGELEASITALVKTETGLADVSASSYLRQADEIFQHEKATTQGMDHPETFIRARALRLWAENDDMLNTWLTATIEGPLAIDELDLAGQRQLAQLTRRLLAELLRPVAFQSDAMLAHARTFFPDFIPGKTPDGTLVESLRTEDRALREYLCFLLLDFAMVDRELEHVPLAAALEWSDRMGIAAEFEKLVLKETGLGKRQISKLKKETPELLKQTEVAV